MPQRTRRTTTLHDVLSQLTAASVLLLASLSWGRAHAQPTDVPTPTVSVAPDAGAMFNTVPVDLDDYGVREQELFFEGTTSAGPYKSRMIVRRPSDARDFNGTVIVEWMNASSGHDIDVDFLSLLPLVAESGYAYVAVTSQQITVDFLRGWNEPRYGALHMLDALPEQLAAYEVFSQAGKAILEHGAGIDPLDGLRAEHLIAIGQSQSSGRLTAMVSNVHGTTLAPPYSAYIPHAGGGAPTRYPVPVLKLNSEGEAPSYFGSRAVADPNYRYWEVPGTAHQPNAGNAYAHDLLASVLGTFPGCQFPYDGPGGPVPIDPVLRAAVTHVDAWIRTGEPPPDAPLIDMVPAADSPTLGVIQRDQYGNALGGIRMPQQEVPTGRNTPSTGCVVEVAGGGATALSAFPQWDAFDGGADPAPDPADATNATEPADARAVYGSHGNYYRKFAAATRSVREQGFISRADALRLILGAAASDIGR